MSEKQIATKEIAEEIWKSLPNPSCAKVHAILNEKGFVTPSVRSIVKWKTKLNWPEPPKPAKLPRNLTREKTRPADIRGPVKQAQITGEAMMKAAAVAMTGN